MLDVAAVAHFLLTSHAPRATRRSLLRLVATSEDASLRGLLFIVALHDLGKLTPGFQRKADWAPPLLAQAGYDFPPFRRPRHHGAAGLALIREAFDALSLPKAAALSLARAVAAHHGEFPTDTWLTRERMGDAERGRSPRWRQARDQTVASLMRHFDLASPMPLARVDHAYIVHVSGLTAVADWLGSMEDVFAYELPDMDVDAYWPMALERAEEALRRAGIRPHAPTTAGRFEALFPGYSPWPLHTTAETLASNLTAQSMFIIEAPMGEGKTEAALLLANAAAAGLGHDGFYVGLPTKATANQMFGRVRTFLDRTVSQAVNLSLTHGDALFVDGFRALLAIYDIDEERHGGVRAEGWLLSKKRALLADYGVGTIDQALLGVLRTRHGFVRLYALAGKTVVLDEVHAYDMFTSTMLEHLVEWLSAMGTTIVLLSATLPRSRRTALVDAFRRGLGAVPVAGDEQPYPRITTISRLAVTVHHVPSRGEPHTVALRRVGPDLEALAHEVAQAVSEGGCVGWICNTVNRAQEACEALARAAPDVPRLLFHARMLPKVRAERECLLEQLLGPEQRGAERPSRYVVIGTQVLEQSLDVDFDLLVTDLAPVDLLLQRAGRLHRHRDRSNRSLAHGEPVLWLAHDTGSPEDVGIRDVATVYAEWLVRQTLRVLSERTQIVLPDDIERLVDAVYGAAPPADDALFGPYIDHFGGAIALRQTAQTRLIPSPAREDDIFRDLTMPFTDDEDPAVHEELRAVTRDGELSVQTVCLVARNGRVYADEEAAEPFDMSAVPDRSLAAHLAQRTISITNPSIVHALLNDPDHYPPAWRDSGVLRYRRALIFSDNVATVAGRRLHLHQELGLRY